LQVPLDDDLQKQGLAGRSECANLGAGGRRFKSGRPDQCEVMDRQTGSYRIRLARPDEVLGLRVIEDEA
jgi:hypothetical protein